MLKSKQAIARDQKVSRQTVHAWMADPRWTLGRKMPIDGEKIDAWRAATFPTSAPASFAMPTDGSYSATRQRVDLQLRAEQTMLLRHKRAILEGKYIDRDLHDRAIVGVIGEFRRRVDDWLESLPPIFAHQSEVQIRELFTDAYDRLCEEMVAMPDLPLADSAEVARVKDAKKAQAAYHKHNGADNVH